MKLNKSYLAPILAVLIVLSGRFFITPEFVIYPYFSSLGMIPYRDIIDQHLPGIFFGPMSMSSYPFMGYFITLVLFVLVVFLIGLATSSKVNQKVDILASVTLVGVAYLLEMEHMWLELIVVSGIWLSMRLYKRSEFFSGLLMAAFIISRPFFVGYWLYVLATKKSISFLKGSIVFGLILVCWFFVNNNYHDFFQLLNFNVNIYKELAYKQPDTRQIIISSIAFFVVFSLSKREIWPAVSISALSAYPRFEMHHLFGLLLGPVLEYRSVKNFYQNLLIFFVVWTLVIIKWWPTRFSGEFFLNAETIEISDEFKVTGKRYGYILGGPDSAYYLAGITPCNNYYLPSLPWYHANETYVEKQLKALTECENETILVNKDSVIDDQQLIGSNSRIYKHIKDRYKLIKRVRNYEFYTD